ncbi:T9SS type A sorting domain-containing protein, partial [Pontibacter saemangeumensis]|uniref:T9SS type A sorting domain-containing protein n=1 Tax=Pontibacter saemangeumensis TaxID=1084525 RepID=UPI0031EDBBC1
SFSWSGVEAGAYSLTARATDNAGAVTTSAAVSVTVTNPPATSSPVISGFSPASGPAGTEVTISGTDLTGVTKVSFGPSTADIKPNSNSGTALVAIVPSVNGKLPKKVNITVTTPGGSATAGEKFTITSALSSATVHRLQETGPEQELVVYPNPFSGKAIISFVLGTAGDYTLDLYDAKGVRVMLLKQGQAEGGESIVTEVNGARLSKGLYLVRLQSASGTKMSKLVLDK